MPTNNDEFPPISSLDDLLVEQDIMDFFGITKSSLTQWRYGRIGPRLPYFRLRNKIYFSKDQLVWWLNEYQRTIKDKMYAERMRRLEEGIKVGRPIRRRTESV